MIGFNASLDAWKKRQNRGTPQTLREAIVNAKADALYLAQPEIDVIEVTLQDFFAQKFCVPMTSGNEDIANAVQDLWTSIFPKKKGEVRS